MEELRGTFEDSAMDGLLVYNLQKKPSICTKKALFVATINNKYGTLFYYFCIFLKIQTLSLSLFPISAE